MTILPRRDYPEPLKEPVGNNQPNLGEDLRKIKRGLSALRIVEDDTSEDFITRALDTGIKVFQKDNGLKVDGILRPGGETERSLFETLTNRPSEELFGPDPMKSTGLGIGFGTGISTLGQLQEAIQKSESPVSVQKKIGREGLSAPYGVIKNMQTQDTPSQPRDIFSTPKPEEQLTPAKQQKIDEETSPVQYDATGRMISPTKNAKQPPVPPEKPPKEPPVPKMKPEVVSPTRKGNEILDMIGKLESSDNYNVLVGGDEAPLTEMTIKEVQELQKKREDNGQGTPVGRYQIKSDTLKETVDKLGINENELFDEKTQDQLARALMERRGYEKYKAGKISTETLIKNLSDEWAALPKDASNKSRYEGISNNRALTKFQTFKELLEKP